MKTEFQHFLDLLKQQVEMSAITCKTKGTNITYGELIGLCKEAQKRARIDEERHHENSERAFRECCDPNG